jgi:hypothetical protein
MNHIVDVLSCVLWLGLLIASPCMHYANPPPVKPQQQGPTQIKPKPVPLPKPRPVVQQAEEIKRQRLILPPLEYDHPFDGEIIIVRTEAEYTPGFWKCRMSHPTPVGCARVGGRNGKCVMYIADDATLQRYGEEYDLVLRHETGHCNGWANHEGARPVGSPPGSPPKQAKAPTR